MEFVWMRGASPSLDGTGFTDNGTMHVSGLAGYCQHRGACCTRGTSMSHSGCVCINQIWPSCASASQIHVFRVKSHSSDTSTAYCHARLYPSSPRPAGTTPESKYTAHAMLASKTRSLTAVFPRVGSNVFALSVPRLHVNLLAINTSVAKHEAGLQGVRSSGT